MRETDFKNDLIDELYSIFSGCLILENDPKKIQGIPDLTILYNDTWAALEIKRSIYESFRPNQEYYLEIMNNMSFASMICPENKEAVLYELQQAFSIRRATRLSKR